MWESDWLEVSLCLMPGETVHCYSLDPLGLTCVHTKTSICMNVNLSITFKMTKMEMPLFFFLGYHTSAE